LSDDIKNWDFYSSAGFWFVVGNTLLFGGTLLFVTKIKPDYCITNKINIDREIGPIKLIIVAYMLVHPFLNVFLVKKSPLPKKVRAYILFGRLLSIMAFVAIFGVGFVS